MHLSTSMTINLRCLNPNLLTDFALEWERCGWEVIPSSFESPKKMRALESFRQYLRFFPLSHRYITDGEHEEQLRTYWKETENNLYPLDYHPVKPTHLFYHVTVQAPPDIKVSELKFPKPMWHKSSKHISSDTIRYNIWNLRNSGFVCMI